MTACLVLGGGTVPGFLADAILQALSVPVLLWSSLVLARKGPSPLGRWLLVLVLLAMVTPLVHLLPLGELGPRPSPAAARAAEIRNSIAASPSSPTWSLAASSTILALLSALPALTVLVGTIALSKRDRRNVTLAVVGVGAVSIAVGLVQVAQGPASPLRLFVRTNPTEAVGFFANRNHFAALLYVLLLIVTAWTLHAGQVMSASSIRHRLEAATLLPLAGGSLLMALALAAQVLARSRAGLGLTMLAVLGGGMLAIRGPGQKHVAARSRRIIAAASIVGGLVVMELGLLRLLERLGADPLADSRIVFAANTIAAAQAHLPFGAGLGRFVPVYALFERPQDALLGAYVNRAHNDALELLLEIGLAGPALLAAFVIWLAVAARRAWGRPSAIGPESDLDVLLARAASVGVVLLLLHSLVDYPLRTAAMLSVLALLVALLVPTVEAAQRQRGCDDAVPAPAAMAGAAATGPEAGQQRWGADIEWPAAWRQDAREP